MNHIHHKNCFAKALALTIGALTATVATADPIISLDLQDYNSDGLKSDFAFFSVPPGNGPNTFGATGETGCTAALDGNTCDPVFFNVGEIGTNVFSTGFNFGGTGIFAPNVTDGAGTGNMDAQIFVADSTGTLGISFTALDFGGIFGGTQFILGPDSLNAVAVDSGFPLTSNGDGTVNTTIRWVGTINDPTSAFNTFQSNWRLEGVATVTDSAPVIFINNGGFGASGDLTTNVAPNVPYVDDGAVCQDVVDGQISAPDLVTTDNNPNTPNTGPGGTFTVVYDCTDSQNNPAQATRTVVVGTDTTPPVLTLDVAAPQAGRSDAVDGTTVDILVGIPYVDAGATCVDDFDGIIALGSTTPPFFSNPDPIVINTSTPSTGNIITFSCDDTALNGPTVAIRTVNVLADNQVPVISLNPPNPQVVAVGGTFLDPGAVCTDTNPVDAGSVDISANLVVDASAVDTNTPGSYPVTYDCADSAGNNAVQVVRTVDVVTGQNFRILSMTISDLDGDGLAGCFKFNSLDALCSLANRFSSDDTGDVGFTDPLNTRFSGSGTDLDGNLNPIGIRFGVFQPIINFIDPPEFGTNPQPEGPITPGFMFTGFPFVPFTFDPPSETALPPSGFVTVSGATSILTIESMPFSGLYNSATPNAFFLDPDDGTLSATITADNMDDNGTTRTFNYVMTWQHIITPLEDPTGAFNNFNAHWRLEGVITADSVPFVVNNPPQVTGISASQAALDPTSIVVRPDGFVTATVTATEPDGEGLVYDWSQSPAAVVAAAVGATDQSSFMFDPAGLPAGPIALRVVVSDDNAASPLSINAQLVLRIVNTAPVLSAANDSDGDGVNDAAEGYGDADNDGIPEYQDAIDGAVDPGRNRIDFSDPASGDIVSSAGRLRLGQVTTAAGHGIFSTTETEIGIFAGPGITPTGNSTDILSQVAGIGPIADGIRDFIVEGLMPGDAVQVVIPYNTLMPALPNYRKYTPTKGWVPFTVGGGNALASAGKLPNGNCPDPTDPAYDAPVDSNGNTFIVEGDECVRLTIVDGGVNDADFTRNGVVVDPGVPAGNGAVPVSAGGGGGCVAIQSDTRTSMRADWWLIGLLLAGLGVRRLVKRQIH